MTAVDLTLLWALVGLCFICAAILYAGARGGRDRDTASEIEARRIENEAQKALEAALFCAPEGDQRSFKGAAE